MKQKLEQLRSLFTARVRDTYMSVRYTPEQIEALNDLATFYAELSKADRKLPDPPYLAIPAILDPTSYRFANKMIESHASLVFTLTKSDIERSYAHSRNTRKAKSNPVGHMLDQAKAEAVIDEWNKKDETEGLEGQALDFAQGLNRELVEAMHGVPTGDYADLERLRENAERKLVRFEEICGLLGLDYDAMVQERKDKQKSWVIPPVDEELDENPFSEGPTGGRG